MNVRFAKLNYLEYCGCVNKQLSSLIATRESV
jgi:hypothetical protein